MKSMERLRVYAMDITQNGPPSPKDPAGPSSYRKKPVVIEAIRWDGTQEARDSIIHWTAADGAIIDTDHIQHLWDHDLGAYVMPTGKVIFAPYQERCLIVATLEGEMVAPAGHWIIRGVQGELYPCDPDIFDATYEPADLTATEIEADRNAALFRQRTSSILLARHEYDGNNFVLHHFTGKLLLGREDLEEAYRQLDDFLYPNPGYAPKIAEAL